MTQAKHNTYKKKKPLVIVLTIAIIAFLAFVLFQAFKCSTLLKAEEFAEITVENGDTANSVGNKLEAARLISYSFEFVNEVKAKNATSKIKAGTYNLEGGKSVSEYADIIITGADTSSPKVVVTEGMRLKDICDAVDATTKGRISSDMFKEATSNASIYASDYDFLKDAESNSLEGFLYPKTYPIKATDSAKDIVTMMLDQFKEETKNLNTSYPNAKNLNMYDIVTLASIVQKESIPGLEKRVASVFYNRLKDHMYLNSDATTAYEVGHDPTPEEVHSNSPYSTYTNYGLPPTPICSPGISAIEAVCEPEETDYYFFFFKGENYAFSKTFEEHQDNIVKLR